MLTEKELETEHTRVLSAKDPVAPQNIVRYSFRERTYKLDASVEQCALHFEMEGNLMHRDSDDGKRIVAEIEVRAHQPARVPAGAERSAARLPGGPAHCAVPATFASPHPCAEAILRPWFAVVCAGAARGGGAGGRA